MIRSTLSSKLLQLATASFVAVLVPGLSQALPPGEKSGVGVNLPAMNYWMSDMPVIDQFKRSSGWLTQCAYPMDANCKDFVSGASSWDTREESKMNLDEYGWVRSLPAANDTNVKFRYVSTLLFQGNMRAHPAGKYTVLYEGKGTIEYALIGTKIAAESTPGRDIVQVTNNTDSGLLISIKASDPADYIRNIRVLPPGGECSNAKGVYAPAASDCVSRGTGSFIPFEKFAPNRPWHPYFVSDLKGFRTLRFVDWGQTTHTTLANWDDRPRRRDAFWTGPSGVPIEAMLGLANTVGSDPWITLSSYVTDDFVKNFGRRAKETLDAGRTLILEYGNEPWNWGFPASLWMRDQGVAKWPNAIAKGESPYILAYNWYAYRSAQVCQIVKTQFGADANRVKCMMNGQAGNSGVSEQMLACPYAAAELGKPCSQAVDALAIAPYFGLYIGDMAHRATVATWFNEPDGGVNKLFQEILAEDANGNKVTPPLYNVTKQSNIGGAVEASKSWITTNKAVAAKHNLPLVAYEGGQHLVMGVGDTDARWRDLFIAGNRDPRMGKAYTRMIENWKAAGGQTFTMFNSVSQPSMWGAWGLKEVQFTTESAKWQAVMSYRDTKACWWTGCSN